MLHDSLREINEDDLLAALIKVGPGQYTGDLSNPSDPHIALSQFPNIERFIDKVLDSQELGIPASQIMFYRAGVLATMSALADQAVVQDMHRQFPDAL